MDEKDRKILAELIQNARIPLSRLGKRVGLSRENCDYRIKKMRQDGVIKEFVTDVDYRLLGFSVFVIFVEYGASPTEEAQLLEEISTHPRISWLGCAAGRWSVTFDVYARNFDELDSIMRSFSGRFEDYTVLHNQHARFFHEKLVGGRTPPALPQPREVHKPDEIDCGILRILCTNCRTPYAVLAREIGLSANAIKWRIKRLERTGIITGHTVVIDHRALGFEWSGVQTKLLHEQDAVRLEEFLASHPQVSFFNRYSKSGQHDYDIGFLGRKSEEVRQFLHELRSTFALKITDTFLVLDQMTTHTVPPGILIPHAT